MHEVKLNGGPFDGLNVTALVSGFTGGNPIHFVVLEKRTGIIAFYTRTEQEADQDQDLKYCQSGPIIGAVGTFIVIGG